MNDRRETRECRIRPTSCTARAWRLLIAALCIDPGALCAQEIYKSVDAQGNVVYSDRPDAPGAEPRPLQVDHRDYPPGMLHFCWTNCFTLVGTDGVYTRADGTDESWTVERFTSSAFVLHRHDKPADWNGFHTDVTYAGSVADDRLVAITVDGRPTADIQMAWGSALDTLPGSNAERDGVRAQPLPPQSAAPPTSDGPDPTISTSEAPPPLQDEDQPPLAFAGGIWTPGHWTWAGRYRWEPGAWVLAPGVGMLWTPGYWTCSAGLYVFHPGYWGTHVGYYGGINYGHGYFGSGYAGGRWSGGTFAYNTAVSKVDSSAMRNTYSEPANAAPATSKASFHIEPAHITKLAISPAHVAGGSTANHTAKPPAPAHPKPAQQPAREVNTVVATRADQGAHDPASPRRPVARTASSGTGKVTKAGAAAQTSTSESPSTSAHGTSQTAKAR